MRSKILFNFLFFVPAFCIAQKGITLYEDSIFKKNSTPHNAKKIKSPAYYYIAFLNDTLLPGAKVVRQLDERLAIITLPGEQPPEVIQRKIKIEEANDNWKFSPAVEKKLNAKAGNGKQKFIVVAPALESLLTVLKTHSSQVTIISINQPANAVIIACSPQYLKDYLIALKEIIYADEYVTAETEVAIIGYNRSFHGINLLDYTLPGANGKNITVGVKEQKMEAADLDLYKRVLPSSIAAANTESHATVISSIIGGAGNTFYDGRGMANGCTFFSSSFANLFADDAAVLNQSNVTVQNHSYGTVPQQFYGAEAVSYDAHAWQNKNFLHVFSAGNRGTLAATEGRYAGITNYANLTGNFKMAKNIITVGAVDDNGGIAAASSAGPIYDGRLAPQLTALGPNGTSDAAAMVSGTIAVMQQVYKDSNSQTLPPASLIKAVLYNTADDIGRKGIDYKTGYGLLNSYAAVKTMQQKKYDGAAVAQNQVWTKNLLIPNGTAAIKLTLAWTDTAATLNNNKAISNDLDLELIELSNGTIYKPWVLSTFANIDSLEKLPTRKRDSLNTAEQISIALPNAGNYQIKVTGTNIVSASPVAFNIAYAVDTLNTFTFINPQHTSDVNRQESENLTVKWRTFVADTNQTGNLFISFNNGSNWQLLQGAIKLYQQQYQWPIKDTATTAVLKMETSFGSFLSKNFIVNKVTRVNVDYICTDSFQLSWDKHIYASGYKIFTLTDSAYLKPILTTADTFRVFKRAAYPSLVYAVEPVLSNNIPAARSIALNIEVQGVNCFYKALNYNLLDGNKLNLTLELSTTKNIDSIAFEKVTQQGQLLQTYGKLKVIDNSLLYNQLVNEADRGITYLRGKIILKNGAVVYTDIISVITSGNKNIIFYPNPVNAATPLKYVLQQGLPGDTQLQFFDISGRIIKNYASIPTTIDISRLPSGIVIYKLLDKDGGMLETGKLVIQR
jgi:Subtilase family